MSAVDVVLQVFRSVEERNPQLAAEVYHDDLEFHWPLPCSRNGGPHPPRLVRDVGLGGISRRVARTTGSARPLSRRWLAHSPLVSSGPGWEPCWRAHFR